MKQLTRIILALCLIFVVTTSQVSPQKQQQKDPVLNFRLTLPQTSNVVYALRYSTFLDAKTANELADILVAQANDTTLNKASVPPAPHK